MKYYIHLYIVRIIIIKNDKVHIIIIKVMHNLLIK